MSIPDALLERFKCTWKFISVTIFVSTNMLHAINKVVSLNVDSLITLSAFVVHPIKLFDLIG